MKIKIYCDGGSRGNPGKAASAFVIEDEKENLIFEKGIYLGIATNNVAEYKALLNALTYLVDNPISDVTVIDCVLDSELLVRQLTGVYKIKNETLLELSVLIKKLEAKLPVKPNYFHVLRHKNKRADALVNQTLDNA